MPLTVEKALLGPTILRVTPSPKTVGKLRHFLEQPLCVSFCNTDELEPVLT